MIMSDNLYEYDVAISFINQDQDIARNINERICHNLTTFVFFDRQQELAGTDSMETFRRAFRSQSRLNVVLFRDGWGNTPWTRIEETAIKERCLADGWDNLLFVMLDNDGSLPKWLPEKDIRFNFEDFGPE
jgi:hypothetical protein